MDLLRAAFLLESELPRLPWMPAWKRRELEKIAHASVRAMRVAAKTIEQLSAAAPPIQLQKYRSADAVAPGSFDTAPPQQPSQFHTGNG